ncbi:MAG: hypothetical protein ACKVPX_09810 [Myxococcaceae bacterium]
MFAVRRSWTPALQLPRLVDKGFVHTLAAAGFRDADDVRATLERSGLSAEEERVVRRAVCDRDSVSALGAELAMGADAVNHRVRNLLWALAHPRAIWALRMFDRAPATAKPWRAEMLSRFGLQRKRAGHRVGEVGRPAPPQAAEGHPRGHVRR